MSDTPNPDVAAAFAAWAQEAFSNTRHPLADALSDPHADTTQTTPGDDLMAAIARDNHHKKGNHQ